MGTGGTAKEQSILIGNAEIRQNLFAASAAERSPISLPPLHDSIDRIADYRQEIYAYFEILLILFADRESKTSTASYRYFSGSL